MMLATEMMAAAEADADADAVALMQATWAVLMSVMPTDQTRTQSQMRIILI